MTVRQIMILTADLGVLLGCLFSGTPGVTVVLVVAPALVGYLCYGVASFRAPPLGVRLGCEVLAACLLALLSVGLWGGYYSSVERECEAMALRASVAASAAGPEARAALERESAWFARRAGELRRRGAWLGLARGPYILSGGGLQCWDEVYGPGLCEQMEKHEKAVAEWIRKGMVAP